MDSVDKENQPNEPLAGEEALDKHILDIGHHLESVDTLPWVGKKYGIRLVQIEGSKITVEIVDPEMEVEAGEPLEKLEDDAKSDSPVAKETKDSASNDKPEKLTYGVEPMGEQRDEPQTYAITPLRTEDHDFSLKVPGIIERIRKNQSVIFEGTRFSGKRQCIIHAISTRINPFVNTNKTRILFITFERESTEFFHQRVTDNIKHLPNVRTSLCVGSTKVRDNIRELEGGCQIVFGTPARLVDLMQRSVLKLQDVSFVVMYCNRHLPAEFQDTLQAITRQLPSHFQYLITYPLGANFDFQLLQTYTYQRFGRHVSVIDNVPHLHRLNIVSKPLFKRDVIWMMQKNQRVGLVCDRHDMRNVDIWLGDIHAPIKCLVPAYRKLPTKGRERRQYIKASKALFKERVRAFNWGILLILQESVKFAPSALDGSLDAIILLGNSVKIHDPDYRDHMLVKPGGHIFTNIPDLQFDAPREVVDDATPEPASPGTPTMAANNQDILLEVPQRMTNNRETTFDKENIENILEATV